MTRQQKYPDTSTFRYFNANPKNRITDDCVIRAISTALNQDYNKTLTELTELSIKTGYMLNCKECYNKYLECKGWVKMKQPRKADNTKYTGKEWCEWLNENDNRNEHIICNIGGHHIVCIVKENYKSFKVWDIWNSTYGCIGNYWIKG